MLQQPPSEMYRNEYFFSPLPVPSLILEALVYHVTRNRILRYIIIYENEPSSKFQAALSLLKFLQ